jgi:type IV secretory pathway TraG/TraD family ATPase VirD4
MEAHDLIIGARQGWGAEVPAYFSVSDRKFHTYIIGKSGSGKSTLLRNLITQEIALGHGVGVIDPHGDLAVEVLSAIPRSRTKHVAYLNPTDEEFPAAFNPLASKARPALAASSIVSAFKHIWKDSWGPRLEYILYAIVAALVECPNTSFLGITRMLHDREYRHWIVRQVSDPMVRSFFINEFEKYDPKFLREAVAPIQNKIGQLLMAPTMRNILGQVKNKIDFRFMMDNSRIFIGNLSKGLMGEDKSNLLGALLVSQFQIAALSRADVDEANRPPFSLFVDEYHNFCSDGFGSILAEARKYGLNVTLAHQYLAQVPEKMQEAVFGNVGNLISFQIGSLDAERIGKEFAQTIPTSNFVNLNKFEAYVRGVRDGQVQAPYLLKTCPPISQKAQHTELLIARSRERFSTRREEVETKLAGWLGKEGTRRNRRR